MIVPGLRKLLADIAVTNPDNKIAKMVASYYPEIRENMSRDNIFELLKDYYNLADTIDLDTIKEFEDIEELRANFTDYDNRDFRIKSFKASSLKGIPNDGNEYGIDFTDNGTINNAIILANNGVGKSSLFAALEMVYTDEIGERRLRKEGGKCSSNDYENYIQRYDTSDKPKCTVETRLKSYNLNQKVFPSSELLNRYSPSNNFISDYDIYSIGQINFKEGLDGEGSLHELVANSLGLSEFMNFRNVLTKVSVFGRRKEKNYYEDRLKQKETKELALKALNERIKDQEDALLKMTKEEKSVAIKKGNELIQVLSGLQDARIGIKSIDDLKESYKKSLSAFLSLESSDKINKEAEFLELGRQLLDLSENCPLCNDSNKEKSEILSSLEDRLKELESKNKVGQELTKSYHELVDELNVILYSFKEIINHILKENELIKDISPLKELSKKESEIYVGFSPFTSDDEMYKYLNVLRNRTTHSIESYNQLLQFIDGPFIKNLVDSTGIFQEFLEYRKSTIESYLKEQEFTADRTLIVKENIESDKGKIKPIEKEIELLDKEVKKAKGDWGLVEEVKDKVSDYLPLLTKKINDLISERFKVVKETVTHVMQDYLQDDEVSIEFDIVEHVVDKDTGQKSDIIQLILVDKDRNKTTPDKYFNTFRYRLFTLMISLSLVIGIRKTYKINLPLVMDDLFAGSDFVSKNSFSVFLMKVIELFYKHTPDLPFQFILFTHDDLIFRSAIDAIDHFKVKENDELCSENKIPLNERTEIGRIFNIDQKDDQDGNFVDALYRLPKYLKEEI